MLWLALLALAGFVVGFALLVAGSLRYGGPEGLLMRVRAEVASQRPHPELVPTPLPTPTGRPVIALSVPVVAGDDEQVAPTAVPPTATAALASETPTALVIPSDVPATPTAAQTASPLPAATPTPMPAAVSQPSLQLDGFSHLWQTWNNCGPATLAMNLSYYGSGLAQADVAAVLKPDANDKNVSPQEMVAFARQQGYGALARVNGDFDRLRQLLHAGVPVLIETWLEHDGGMGHYRLITGYDDMRQEWIVYDSYVSAGVDPDKPYTGIRLPYGDMDRLWAVFNRTYVLVYDEARAAAVQDILGADLDDTMMWERVLARNQQDVLATPDDAFAWFNLGSSLVALGRYEEAAGAYDQARVIGLPWRMLWYQFGPFVAYHETGRYAELIALADSTIGTAGNIEETFFWKGRGLLAVGDLGGARQAFKRAAELNPNFADAQVALTGMGG